MKIKTTTAAFAAVLLAGTATLALAQDQKPRDHRDWDHAVGERHPASAASPPQAATPQIPPTPPQPRTPPSPGQGYPSRGDGSGRERGRWNGQEGEGQHWRGAPGTPDAGRPQAPPPQATGRDRGFGDHGRRDPAPNTTTPPNAGAPGAWNGRDHRGGDRDHARGDRDHRDDGERSNWRGGERDRDHRPQWRPGYFPPAFRSEHRFRVSPWFPPPGYGFREWRYGDFLPQAWWTPRYRILDWWDFDLPEPPPGFMWIRSGPDALLIDPYGRIAQVVDLIFW